MINLEWPDSPHQKLHLREFPRAIYLPKVLYSPKCVTFHHGLIVKVILIAMECNDLICFKARIKTTGIMPSTVLNDCLLVTPTSSI